MKKPNFFILGAPKCGTSALAFYLKSHPNVFFCEPKEPEYFDFDLTKPSRANLSEYLKMFSAVDEKRHLAIGEGTTTYLFSDCAVDEILKFNSDSRFIVMLRNPIDLIQSFHAQLLFNGQETVSDFKTAWSLVEERRKGKKVPISCSKKEELLYSEIAMLGKQTERLLQKVEEDRVLFVVFENFINHTKDEYERVLKFLNLPLDGKTIFPAVNENKENYSRSLQRLLSIISIFIMRVKAKFGLKTNFGLVNFFLAKNRKKAARNKISDEFLQELKNFYRKDVYKLSDVTGLNLNNWVDH